jgi:hypothetical protein
MKFRSLDSHSQCECETQIRIVKSSDIDEFVNTWVTFTINKMITSSDFDYQLFPWDKIINASLTMGFGHKCYCAITNLRIDGMLALRKDNSFYIDFIATAPWNYYKSGKMRRIGEGLIYYTIKMSQYVGLNGEFILNALPAAEQFYENIGMVRTGNSNTEGLKEYRMSKDKASIFENKFNKHIISISK